MDLLLITDYNKSHYFYIKDFNRFMCCKTKGRTEKHFVINEFKINVASQLFFTKEKMQSIHLLKQFLKRRIIAKK